MSRMPFPPLRSDAIQVLLRRVTEGAAPSSDVSALLSDEETARAARFVRNADRFRFVEAHAFLRWL